MTITYPRAPGLSGSPAGPQIPSWPMEQQADGGHPERLLVKSGGRISFLRPDDIGWIEACGDYVCLHAHGRKLLIRERISNLERRLLPSKFLRIHRSTIVNIDSISEMQPLPYGEYVVVLNDGTRLTLSRSFRAKVFHRLTGAS